MVFWPIQKFCNKCGENTSWVESSCKGTIIEFSKKESEFFGIVKIDENIRLLGKIISSELPHIGQPVIMKVRDRKSTRLNSSHSQQSRMPSSA